LKKEATQEAHCLFLNDNDYYYWLAAAALTGGGEEKAKEMQG
jgi:hypothetical protein